MGALTQDRNTPERDGKSVVYPVAAGAKIFAGSLVVLDGGVAKPGFTDAAVVAVGRAEATVDNTAGQDGDESILVTKGCFRFANLSTDAVTLAEAETSCYIVDDQTVAKTSGTGARSVAGTVLDVETAGVWVRI